MDKINLLEREYRERTSKLKGMTNEKDLRVILTELKIIDKILDILTKEQND